MGSSAQNRSMIIGAGTLAVGLVMVPPNPGLIISGAIIIVGALMQPKVNDIDSASSAMQSQSVTAKDPVSPYQVIYGNIRAGGTITFLAVSGTMQEYLHMIITMAYGPVDSINEMYFGDELVPLDGSGDAIGRYAGFVHVEKELGTPTQPAYAGLIAATTPEIVAGFRRFDGHGQFGKTAAVATLDPAILTVAAWVAVHEIQDSTIWQLTGSWHVRFLETSVIEFTDSVGHQVTAPWPFPLFEAHYLACVGDAAGLRIYFDGVLQASYTTNPYTAAAAASRVFFVASEDGTLEQAGIDTADLVVWNFFRLPVDQQADADAGDALNTSTTGLLAFWIDMTTDTGPHGITITLNNSWTSAHQQRGFANVWVRLKWDQTLFSAGAPAISFNVKGRPVYDPRTTLTAWSDNPALIVADFLQTPVFGLSVGIAKIDNAALIAAANHCDELVTLASGGTEKRYTLNGSSKSSSTPQQNLTDLLTAMSGTLVYAEGLWHIYAGVYITPTLSFNENDLRDTVEITSRLGRAQTFNAVKGTYYDPITGQPTEYPPVISSAYATQDGETIYQDFNQPFTQSITQAQRNALILLLQARQQITVIVRGRLSMWQAQPPDTIMLSIAAAGWTNKVFQVVQSQMVVDQGGALGCDLTLRETDPSVYTWTTADEGAFDPAPDSNLPDVGKIVPPRYLTLDSGTSVLDIRLDGTIFSRIKVSWDAIDDQFVVSGGAVEVQFKKHTEPTVWSQSAFAPGASTFMYILDVGDGVSYDIRARSVNFAGVASDWVEIDNYVVIGKTQPPGNVQNFKALQSGNLVVMSWTQIPDLDLAGYDIRAGTVGAPFNSSAVVSLIEKGTAVTTAIVPPGTWDVMIKAKDTSGNTSPMETRQTITVVAAFNPSYQVKQDPTWDGVLTGLIRNPLTGYLSPDSTSLASALGWEVFDDYVFNPVASATYAGTEIDVGADSQVNIWSTYDVIAGPGETSAPSVSFLVDHHLTADGYTGFSVWLLGQISARYVKEELGVAPVLGSCPLFRAFTEIVDLVTISEVGTNVAIPTTGLRINFARTYREPPDFILNAFPAGTTVVAFDDSLTGITVWILNNATGLLVAGNISYTIEGT